MAFPGCGRCGDPCAAACDHSYACKVLVALRARFVAERAVCRLASEFAILSDRAEVFASLSPASGGPSLFLAVQAERAPTADGLFVDAEFGPEFGATQAVPAEDRARPRGQRPEALGEHLGPTIAVIVVRADLLLPQVLGRLWSGRRAADVPPTIPVESRI